MVDSLPKATRADQTVDFFLVGAGALGREIAGWHLSSQIQSGPRLVGFIDQIAERGVSRVDIGEDEFPVYSEQEALKTARVKYFVPGIANPVSKTATLSQLQAGGMRPLSLVHSSVILAPGVTIGEGVVICPHVTVSISAVIEEFVLLNVGTRIGHDSRIGAYSTLLGGNLINGNVTIGKRVTVGSGAILHPGVSIAEDATIGVGSVVVRNVNRPITVFGNPARELR